MEIKESYNRLAHEYAEQFSDELSHAPFDRALLDVFASEVKGRVGDLGCGPARWPAIYIAGESTSAGWIFARKCSKEARTRLPGISFQHGSLLDLPLEEWELRGLNGLLCHRSF